MESSSQAAPSTDLARSLGRMRFATAKNRIRDPYPLQAAAVRGGGGRAAKTRVRGRRRLARPRCRRRGAPPVWPPPPRRRLHKYTTPPPPSRAPLQQPAPGTAPGLPHPIRIELPSYVFDDGDGHDRRREVGLRRCGAAGTPDVINKTATRIPNVTLDVAPLLVRLVEPRRRPHPPRCVAELRPTRPPFFRPRPRTNR